MKTRALIVFWLALIVVTLGLGALLARLLQHEEERLRAAWLDHVRAQSSLLARQLDNTVREHQAELQRLVLEARENPLVELPELSRRHPLVRHAFIWRDGHLLHPDPEQPMTTGEQQFVQRYQPLLLGQEPWLPPADDDQQEQMASRDSLFRWIPWHSGGQLGMLGVFVHEQGRAAQGIEMEMMALLARLLTVFKQQAPADYAFLLLDERENVLACAGAEEPGEQVLEMPVSPALPMWRLRIATADGHDAGMGGLARFAAGSLAAIFLLVLLACGSVLFWLARKNALDARRKTNFVSNVSHELKTPLTTIRMYAEMLAEDRIRDADKRRHYLTVITEQSLRLTRLVNNALDFGRLEQGHRVYRNEPVNVREEIRRVLEEQRPRIVEAGMELVLDLPEDREETTIRTDRDVLEQALLNLIDNAIKYAAAGGKLSIRAGAEGDHLRVTIADQGPGIPRAHRGRLFRPFFRADHSLTAVHAGCGLGLSISRQLLRDVGGDLRYEEGRGKGASFTIILPKGLS